MNKKITVKSWADYLPEMQTSILPLSDNPDPYESEGIEQPQTPPLALRVVTTRHNASLEVFDPATKVELGEIFLEYYEGRLVVRLWDAEDVGGDPNVTRAICKNPARAIERWRGDYQNAPE
jgi:hypothetical protein